MQFCFTHQDYFSTTLCARENCYLHLSAISAYADYCNQAHWLHCCDTGYPHTYVQQFTDCKEHKAQHKSCPMAQLARIILQQRSAQPHTDKRGGHSARLLQLHLQPSILQCRPHMANACGVLSNLRHWHIVADVAEGHVQRRKGVESSHISCFQPSHWQLPFQAHPRSHSLSQSLQCRPSGHSVQHACLCH